MSVRRQHGGFTMLELLVVLLLVALVTGMTVPLAGNWLRGAQERALRRDLQASIESLPMQAFRSGQAIELDARQLMKRLPTAPAGLTVELATPLRYGADGVAGGGDLSLRLGDGPWQRWRVLPVTGELALAAGGGAGDPSPWR